MDGLLTMRICVPEAPRAWISNYIPQYMWDVITCPCPPVTCVRWSTVYPKKYAHGFCFAVLCCGYTLTDFPISIRLTSLALWQSNDCPSASKVTLINMDKYFMWIHYERLHNHNKANHNETVCIFLGIYCISHEMCDQIHILRGCFTSPDNRMVCPGAGTLRWRQNGRDSVSNHQPRHCLLSLLFGRRSKKTSKLRVTGLCVGNSPGPVNSPYKGPVTRKMFPFDDVIMKNHSTETKMSF